MKNLFVSKLPPFYPHLHSTVISKQESLSIILSRSYIVFALV